MPELGEIRKSEELGYKSRNKTRHIWMACPICKKERWVQLKYGNTPLSKYCRICANTGERNPLWKGGRVYSRQEGYFLVQVPHDNFFFPMTNKPSNSVGGYVMEHRLVMAKHLGRNLQRWEVVHHKNGIKDDNRIENLELSTVGGHSLAHSKGYRDGYKQGYDDALRKLREVNFQ